MGIWKWVLMWERGFFLPFYFIIEEFLISVEVIDLSFCQWKFFTSNVLKTSSLPLSVICSSDYTSSPLQCWSQWFWDSAFTHFLCFCVLKSTYACCFERTWFSLIVYWKSGTHMPSMHCDVCWESHNCWKFHCKMPDMRGGRMEEIRKKPHAISSSEQGEQSGLSGLVCGEQSVWCYGLVPTLTGFSNVLSCVLLPTRLTPE